MGSRRETVSADAEKRCPKSYLRVPNSCDMADVPGTRTSDFEIHPKSQTKMKRKYADVVRYSRVDADIWCLSPQGVEGVDDPVSVLPGANDDVHRFVYTFFVCDTRLQRRRELDTELGRDTEDRVNGDFKRSQSM